MRRRGIPVAEDLPFLPDCFRRERGFPLPGPEIPMRWNPARPCTGLEIAIYACTEDNGGLAVIHQPPQNGRLLPLPNLLTDIPGAERPDWGVLLQSKPELAPVENSIHGS